MTAQLRCLSAYVCIVNVVCACQLKLGIQKRAFLAEQRATTQVEYQHSPGGTAQLYLYPDQPPERQGTLAQRQAYVEKYQVPQSCMFDDSQHAQPLHHQLADVHADWV